ncbi:hypothetical protein [Silvibacterium acidisoli]|uniref:hypothetical protein n=1 Tax=Acidobacteriaceae bacterium ZG23-2 TaxID=2883246 RepID=UPI00406BF08D
MNHQILSIPLFLAAVSAGAQAPGNSPPPPSAAQVAETSHIARFVAGPGDRLQGLMLRNGTFVVLSPGLAQRIPSTLRKSASVQVAGDEFSYSGSKTIQARAITIAGVSYADDAPRVGPGPAGGPPAPPREPRGRRDDPRPCDAPLPPPQGAPPPDGVTPPAPPPPTPQGL